MKVVLPWPPKELSPNARVHWGRKAKAAARYKTWAFIGACAQGRDRGASVAVKFCPPDNRHRDLDNMLASIKSGLDGISEAIGVDDSKWSITITKGEPVKGGQVIVEVTG